MGGEGKDRGQSARRQAGPSSTHPRYVWAKLRICDTPSLDEHSSMTLISLYTQPTAPSPCCLAQDIRNKTTRRTSPSSQVSVTLGNKSCQVCGVSVWLWNPGSEQPKLRWLLSIMVPTPEVLSHEVMRPRRVSGFWIISDYPGSRSCLFSGSIKSQPNKSKRHSSARLNCWQVSNAWHIVGSHIFAERINE